MYIIVIIPPTNYYLLLAQQEPKQKRSEQKKFENLGGKNQQNRPLAEKRQDFGRGLGRETREKQESNNSPEIPDRRDIRHPQ